MNTTIAKGVWKELKGDLKQTWSKLTDNDIAYLHGNAEELVGKIQQVYGFSKERAQKEFDRFKETHSNYFRDERENTNTEDSMGTTIDGDLNKVKNKASGIMEDGIFEPAKDYLAKARELGSMAVNKSTDFVKTYPGYTLLGAAAIGFLAGAYFTRRR